jgi:hypothetical protein
MLCCAVLWRRSEVKCYDDAFWKRFGAKEMNEALISVGRCASGDVYERRERRGCSWRKKSRDEAVFDSALRATRWN